ncbi:MAG TPA: hypothetical protein PLO51_04490, partial [Candidatus Micrarchaeota archaeon]|nr:hypothetical protein [Candidatus Micrarchaeota archaeon]
MAQKLWIGSFARTNVRMGSERSKKQGLGNDSGARGGREGRRARIGGRDFDSKSGQKSKGFRRDSPEG